MNATTAERKRQTLTLKFVLDARKSTIAPKSARKKHTEFIKDIALV